jgi:DNA repair exonuclease SbcCD ATPase subunit
MKKINFLLICLAVLALSPSCRRSSNTEQPTAQDSINSQLSDSLSTALAEKDSLMSLVSDISDGMTQIKEMQNIVSSSNLSSETPDKKAQLRSDMVAIQQNIQDREKRLKDLEARLSKSTNYTADMKKTIQNLKKQLEDQQNSINDLTQQLAAAHIQIKTLNSRVDSLNSVNTTVTAEKTKAQEETVRLGNEMNVCYYVIGSKAELKKYRIIETGFLKRTKIMEGDYEKSYFIKADKRSLSEIQLHNRKAQVLSKHPASSYVIVDENGQKTLKILNSTKFWELSNYLIIKVG